MSKQYKNNQDVLVSPNPEAKWALLVEAGNIWQANGDDVEFTLETSNGGWLSVTLPNMPNVFEEVTDETND